MPGQHHCSRPRQGLTVTTSVESVLRASRVGRRGERATPSDNSVYGSSHFIHQLLVKRNHENQIGFHGRGGGFDIG